MSFVNVIQYNTHIYNVKYRRTNTRLNPIFQTSLNAAVLENPALPEAVAKVIEALRIKYKVTKSHTILDEDGLGAGVKDMLKCKGFINNSRAVKIKGKDVNFSNIKAQCYFKLADVINDGLLYINCSEVEKDLISSELEVVKMRDMDKDTKLNILDKATVKSLIGRSPDFSDMIMMRMFFTLSAGSFKPTRSGTFSRR